MPDLECRQRDVFNDESELEVVGDKQFLHKPDSSSLSSSSDSEETYMSDRATEEDLDLQLEGIGSLLGDSEHLASNEQQVREDEEKRVSGNELEDARSPIDRGFIEDKTVEWKDVQTLLSNMGIQLIRDTSTTNFVRQSSNFKKTRGKRELQSLKFNVNYDRSSCSRGKHTYL